MKRKTPPFLSKSKYMEGLQCPKLLWYEYNRRQDIPKVDALRQAIFDQGKKVGQWAQKLFPEGIRLERRHIPEKHAEQSLKSLKLRKPLFEGGFVYRRAYALADILVSVDEDAWDLIEVKSSTGIKNEHLTDVAFQKYTYEGAGIKIHRCYLMYINNQYVRRGKVEPEKLFLKEDITKQINALKTGIEKEVAKMLKVITGENMPDVRVGPHCNKPYTCPLKDICWDFLPDKGHVFMLSGGKKLAFEFIKRGILKIADISDNFGLKRKQVIQVGSHKAQEPYIDKEAIKEFMSRLKYPLYFLDFETIGPAIPVYELSRPYENIMFQYSLHVVKNKGVRSMHYSYLAPGDKDPRPEILKQLKNLLGNSGSIMAYNASFEIDVLRGAVEIYPEFKNWFEKVEGRFVDLLGPFRNFFYYHPAQGGSASLKKVLPAVTDFAYKDMEIANGAIASHEYCRVTFNKDVGEEERRRVRAALEKYCHLDTMGMIKIVDVLRQKSK